MFDIERSSDLWNHVYVTPDVCFQTIRIKQKLVIICYNIVQWLMICCVCWGLYTLVYPQHMHNVHYFAVYTSVHKPRELARTLRRGTLSKDKQHAPRNDASLPSRQMSGKHLQENNVISPTQAQARIIQYPMVIHEKSNKVKYIISLWNVIFHQPPTKPPLWLTSP